jgi:PAS domain S-box-containing protein
VKGGSIARETVFGSALSDFIFPQRRSSPAVCYALAAGICLAAFLVRLAVDPLLQDHSPLVLFSLAVATSAIRGGFGPGLFATCLGAFLAVYFFPPQGKYFAIDPNYRSTAVFQLLVFLIVGFILSWLSGSLLDLRWKAVRLAQERSEILESITDGFAALDNSQRFMYLNSTAARLIGAATVEVIGKNVWEVVPDWKGGPVQSGCRDASERQVPIRFEYQSRSSGRWLEFHIDAVENGHVTIYFSDVTERKGTEQRLRDTLAERDAALKNVHLLTGLLPICAACKKIRDEAGAWQQLEKYISTHSQAEFSHGLCTECAERYLADLLAPRNS